MKPNTEWLETDGLGGYALGRADGIRTRACHSLLTIAGAPPTGRLPLVKGVDAWIDSAAGSFAISSQRYATDVTHPDGSMRLVAFTTDPWPTWTYRLPNGVDVIHEFVMRHGAPLAAMSWRLSASLDARLVVRPFLSAHEGGGSAHENHDFSFDDIISGQRISWQPYAGVPPIVAVTNGDYLPYPTWYRNFQYDEERARGLEFLEDLASPGTISFSLASGRAVVVFGADTPDASPLLRSWALRLWSTIAEDERERRSAFRTPLHRAADAYLVGRGRSRTIIASYPSSSSGERDALFALRGLCIAGDRMDDGRDILLEWARRESEGMSHGSVPEPMTPAEFDSAGTSLWYVTAVHDFLQAAEPRGIVTGQQVQTLGNAIEAIVSGYAHGTRAGLRADGTGLLAAGVEGLHVAQRNASGDDWMLSPRTGKTVEIQALWINALRIAARWAPRWNALADYAQGSFIETFWNAGGYLNDVADLDDRPGTVDPSFRPYQILAVGGLPFPALQGDKARRVVDAVETRLWTAAGPPSLATDDSRYSGRCAGDVHTLGSDACHEGAVWPWLVGAFVDAWVRVRGGGDDVKLIAREKFLRPAPLLADYESTSAGQIAPFANGHAPQTSNGWLFQACSVGEALWLSEDVLRTASPGPSSPSVQRRRRRSAEQPVVR